MYTLRFGRYAQIQPQLHFKERWGFLEAAELRASDLIKMFDWCEIWHDTTLYGGTEVCHAVHTKKREWEHGSK